MLLLFTCNEKGEVEEMSMEHMVGMLVGSVCMFFIVLGRDWL